MGKMAIITSRQTQKPHRSVRVTGLFAIRPYALLFIWGSGRTGQLPKNKIVVKSQGRIPLRGIPVKDFVAQPGYRSWGQALRHRQDRNRVWLVKSQAESLHTGGARKIAISEC